MHAQTHKYYLFPRPRHGICTPGLIPRVQTERGPRSPEPGELRPEKSADARKGAEPGGGADAGPGGCSWVCKNFTLCYFILLLKISRTPTHEATAVPALSAAPAPTTICAARLCPGRARAAPRTQTPPLPHRAGGWRRRACDTRRRRPACANARGNYNVIINYN